MNNILSKSYIFSFAFVHAFTFLDGKFSLSLIVGVLMFIYAALYRIKIKFNYTYIFSLIFFAVISISVLLNSQIADSKILSHSFAWVSVLFFFYIIPNIYFNFYFSKINLCLILMRIYYFSIVYSIIEFISYNFLQYDIDKLLIRPFEAKYDPTFWGIFIRARSFFPESGYFGMFVLMLFPIVIYYRRMNSHTITADILVLIVVLFVIFSTTAFLLILISICLYLLIVMLRKKSYFISISLFISLIGVMCFDFIMKILDIIILSKFNSSSFADRVGGNNASIDVFANSQNILNIVFGFGPGSYSYLDIRSSVSTYVNLFRDLGLLGFILFCVNIFFVLFSLYKSDLKVRKYLFFSVFYSIIYFQTNTSYYFAFIWFVYVLCLNIKYFKRYEFEFINSNSLFQ